MPKSLMIVLTNPASEDQRAEFERWYDERHLHEVAALPGVISATRYRTVPDTPVFPGLPGVSQASMAIYELEARDEAALRAVTAAMQQGMESGAVEMSATLDMPSAVAFFLMPVSPTVTSG